MGILDDAIRQHLDLKRRHGADPAEVDRLEREALGPVRRGSEGAEPAGAGTDADLDAYDDSGPRGPTDYRSETGWDDDFEDTDVRPGYGRKAPERGSGRLRTATDGPSALDDSAARKIPPPHQARRAPASEPGVDLETAEFDVERALAGESAERGEDVLEETPEFLQDAPDHDRLWFEQRPPRDFDFDG